uniref:START domain-containing protein n=1 Tax=Opuntia streptacantha TaxID=393608 RepID=A0A7C9EJR4_OPUST
MANHPKPPLFLQAQNERADNSSLRLENNKFRCENMAIREALKSVICPSCGGPPSGEEERKQSLLKLQHENAELKLEYERISSMLANYMGRPLPGDAFNSKDASRRGHENGSTTFKVDSVMGNINVGDQELVYQMKAHPEIENSLVAQLASNAMDELIKLLSMDEPLWIKSPGDDQYILDRSSYDNIISRSVGFRYPKSRIESSKDSGVVVMNARSLVDLCLDPDKWLDFFPTVVSEARILRIIEAGLLGNRSGSLQLIYEQMHVLSPLVQAREFYVLRYCQQIEMGTWVIADVSCDYIGGHSHISPTCCWKHPSGFMIQELSNGLTKVSCIEHVEIDDQFEVHAIYEDLVKSALGFGAKRWVMALQRACERYTYMVEAGRPGRELRGGWRSVITLACRMVKSYCSIFTFLGTAEFRQSSEMTDSRVHIVARKNTCPGQPRGIVISAASSFWVPAPHERVLKYLSDHIMRSQWDVLCFGNPVREVMHIPTGSHSANRISVLQPQNPCENIMIFQESMMEQLGSLIVYTPIDTSSMRLVATGVGSTNIPILASGFAVTTDGPDQRAGASTSTSIAGPCGSLLTVAFQILACSSLSTDNVRSDCILNVEGFVSRAVRVIKSAFDFST